MNNSYEMVGMVKVLKDLMTFPSGFTKREFVIETENGNYPDVVSFSCLKNNTALLDSVKVGDRVKVTFSIRGREYKERYFNDLVVFKIAKVADDGSTVEYDQVDAAAKPAAPAAVPAPVPAAASSSDDGDAAPADADIPF